MQTPSLSKFEQGTTMSLVSIITPAFNAAPYIEEMLESVRAQTYQEWELLVCDDGSTDATSEIVNSFVAKDCRIRLVGDSSHAGPALARNECISRSYGQLIAFLDADDVWEPVKLERQVSFMRDTKCVLSYTGYRKIDRNSASIGEPVNIPTSVSYEQLLRGPIIACLTAMYDADQLGKVYMPEIKKRQDFGLWLSILRRGHQARGLNECLASYRVTPESLSSNKLSAARYVWNIYRDVEELSFVNSLRNFAGYAAGGIKKSLNR